MDEGAKESRRGELQREEMEIGRGMKMELGSGSLYSHTWKTSVWHWQS